MSFKVKSIDHLVLTVADIGRSLQFYERVVGMQPVTFRRQPLGARIRQPEDQPARDRFAVAARTR